MFEQKHRILILIFFFSFFLYFLCTAFLWSTTTYTFTTPLEQRLFFVIIKIKLTKLKKLSKCEKVL